MTSDFFSRWSQRKQAVAKGLPVAEPSPPVRPPPADKPAPTAPSAAGMPASPPPAPVETAPAEPLPSLDDARALTPASDFQPFMRPGVASDVRNVAMKKLFSDPHFNVMDGLDIYIGDYNTPDPLPAGMLQKMVGAQLLNLFPDDKAGPPSKPALEVNPEARPATPNDTPDVAQSPPPQSTLALPANDSLDHDDPDLQLQPNHAPAGPRAGSSTG